MSNPVPTEIKPLTVEQAKQRRRRSIALALVLAAAALLFYAMTIVKMDPNILFNRAL